jgi:hypothetical protein
VGKAAEVPLMPTSKRRRFAQKFLPRTWVLQYDRRRTNRIFRPLIANAKGDERRKLVDEHMWELASIEEQLEGIQTARVLRQARKYYIVTPEIKLDEGIDEGRSWQRGWASDTLYLKPAAVASLLREIEDTKRRRRDVWESWIKILGGLITALVALGSVIVSLVLAWRR